MDRRIGVTVTSITMSYKVILYTFTISNFKHHYPNGGKTYGIQIFEVHITVFRNGMSSI